MMLRGVEKQAFRRVYIQAMFGWLSQRSKGTRQEFLFADP